MSLIAWILLIGCGVVLALFFFWCILKVASDADDIAERLAYYVNGQGNNHPH